jgi:hypothetical protein
LRIPHGNDVKRVIANGNPLLRGTPPIGNGDALAGRSPGLRVVAKGPGLPRIAPSGAYRAVARRLQLRGQPRIRPEGRTAFPFNPPGGEPSMAGNLRRVGGGVKCARFAWESLQDFNEVRFLRR